MSTDPTTPFLLRRNLSKSHSLMMPRNCCWVSAFVSVWWLPLMLAAAQERPGDGCSGSATRCGNVTISAPFSLRETGTQGACGSTDFQITCLNNSSPVLPSFLANSLGFAIMDISYEEDNMRVVDMGKQDLLQASNSCHVPMRNTSDKLGRPFRIDPVSLNLVIYNCTKASGAAAAGLVGTRMRCGNESQVFVRTERRSAEPSAVEGCDAAVILPVLGGANGEANASDYEQLISDGFVLTTSDYECI